MENDENMKVFEKL